MLLCSRFMELGELAMLELDSTACPIGKAPLLRSTLTMILADQTHSAANARLL